MFKGRVTDMWAGLDHATLAYVYSPDVHIRRALADLVRMRDAPAAYPFYVQLLCRRHVV